MLILSRRKGQSVIIGRDIAVTVKDIRGKTVKLSIETPAGVMVFREEVFKEIADENRRAAMTPTAGELPLGPGLAKLATRDAEEDP